MKKLLALFIIGGLLSTITGCPPATSTSGPKKGGASETKIEQRKTGDADKKSDTGPKMDEKKPDTGTKIDEKKSGPDKSGTGGTKKEETKTEKKDK